MLSKNLAVATAVSALMPLGSAFDAQSKSNVAIYYVWPIYWPSLQLVLVGLVLISL